MSPLPWYCIWADFSTHEKTLDLCDLLKDRNAGMYVIRLFEQCARHALDGRIKASIIEEVARWRGKPGVLLSALEAAKVLDIDGDVRVVHGWEERNGGRIKKAMRDATKPRGNKARPAPVPQGTSEGPALDRCGKTDTKTETERENPQASMAPPPRDRSGGGQDDDLEGFRTKLASQLGVPHLGLGKDARRAIASVNRWLDAGYPENDLVLECARLAREKGVTPAHLSWWPGWLDTVSDNDLARCARELQAGGAR